MRFKRKPMSSKTDSENLRPDTPEAAEDERERPEDQGRGAGPHSGEGARMKSESEASNVQGDDFPDAFGGDADSEAPTEEASGGDRESTAEDIAAEYLDQLQRLKAEFDNYRRRVLREREEWFTTARADVIRGLLPMLDDLRRARAHQQADKAGADVAGLLLILKRFEDVLTQQGLKEQEVPPGTEFDPERHEAVMHIPSADIPEGHIIQVVEPGYILGTRLLRTGKVAVSSGPATE